MNGNLYNPKFGYYQYNNQIFSTKEDMFDYILENCNDEQIKNIPNTLYNFHNEVFQSIDWRINPTFSINELYKIRAQQLRDEYDYLILLFSGGADSTQVLNTFLENDIFIDEIQNYNYDKALKSVDRDIFNKFPSIKILLEYEYAAKPILKKVKQKSPNTKITFVDTSDYAYDQIVNKKFDFLGNKYHNSHTLLSKAYRSFTPYTAIYNQQNNNKNKVALIRGNEKPNLRMDREWNLYFTFQDFLYPNVKLSRMGYTDPNIEIEDFYWSKDMPLIPVKQSHLILDKMKNDNEYLKTVLSFFVGGKSPIQQNFDMHNKTVFFKRNYIDPVIYPNWQKTFSAEKIGNVNPEFEIFKNLNYIVYGYDQMKSHGEYIREKYKRLPIKFIGGLLETQNYLIGNLKSLIFK